MQDDYVLISEKSGKNNNNKQSPCNELITDIENSLNCSMQTLNDKFEKYVKCINNSLSKISEIVFGEQNNEEIVKNIKKIKCELESIKSAICRLEFDKDELIEQTKVIFIFLLIYFFMAF